MPLRVTRGVCPRLALWDSPRPRRCSMRGRTNPSTIRARSRTCRKGQKRSARRWPPVRARATSGSDIQAVRTPAHSPKDKSVAPARRAPRIPTPPRWANGTARRIGAKTNRNRLRRRTSSCPPRAAPDWRTPAACAPAAWCARSRAGIRRIPRWSPGNGAGETARPSRDARGALHRGHRPGPSKTRRPESGSSRARLLAPLRLRLDDGELQLALGGIHAIQRHTHSIADRKLAPRALADNLAHILVIGVAVPRQRVDGHQTLDEHLLQLDEEAVLGGADGHRPELLSQPRFHEFDLLPLHQFALGIRRAALRLGAIFGHGAQFGFGRRGFLLQGGSQQTVHHQVRIAADGRGEMRVEIRREGEVTGVICAVARLL